MLQAAILRATREEEGFPFFLFVDFIGQGILLVQDCTHFIFDNSVCKFWLILYHAVCLALWSAFWLLAIAEPSFPILTSRCTTSKLFTPTAITAVYITSCCSPSTSSRTSLPRLSSTSLPSSLAPHRCSTTQFNELQPDLTFTIFDPFMPGSFFDSNNFKFHLSTLIATAINVFTLTHSTAERESLREFGRHRRCEVYRA